MEDNLLYNIEDYVEKIGKENVPLFRLNDRELNLWTDNFLFKFTPSFRNTELKLLLHPENLFVVESPLNKGAKDYNRLLNNHVKGICLKIANNLSYPYKFHVKSKLTGSDLKKISGFEIDNCISKTYSNFPKDIGLLKRECIYLIDSISDRNWDNLICFSTKKSWSNLNQDENYIDLADMTSFIIIDSINLVIWVLILNLYLEQ